MRRKSRGSSSPVDLRYRNETFDVQYVDRNRSRDRIRARLNATFRANDTVTGAVRPISTGSRRSALRATRRSPTRTRARTSISTSAYVTWAPNASWKFTAGKQRYPWQRTGAFFYDNDVNPEGIAINYATGNFFASTFYDWLAERALSFSAPTGTNTDSIMYGAQVGYRIPI